MIRYIVSVSSLNEIGFSSSSSFFFFFFFLLLLTTNDPLLNKI